MASLHRHKLPEQKEIREDPRVDGKANLTSKPRIGLQSTQPLWRRKKKTKIVLVWGTSI